MLRIWPLRFFELFEGRAADVKGSFRVDIDDRPETVRRSSCALQRKFPGRAVDDDVDPAVMRDRFGDRLFDRRVVSNVRDDCQTFAARFLDELFLRDQIFFLARSDRDPRPGFGKGPRDAARNSSRAPVTNATLPCKILSAKILSIIFLKKCYHIIFNARIQRRKRTKQYFQKSRRRCAALWRSGGDIVFRFVRDAARRSARLCAGRHARLSRNERSRQNAQYFDRNQESSGRRQTEARFFGARRDADGDCRDRFRGFGKSGDGRKFDSQFQKPRFVAIADTHTWNRYAVQFVENSLANLSTKITAAK